MPVFLDSPVAYRLLTEVCLVTVTVSLLLQQFAKIMSIAKYLCSASGVVSEIGNVVNESSASAVLECAPTGDRY